MGLRWCNSLRTGWKQHGKCGDLCLPNVPTRRAEPIETTRATTHLVLQHDNALSHLADQNCYSSAWFVSSTAPTVFSWYCAVKLSLFRALFFASYHVKTPNFIADDNALCPRAAWCQASKLVLIVTHWNLSVLFRGCVTHAPEILDSYPSTEGGGWQYHDIIGLDQFTSAL